MKQNDLLFNKRYIRHGWLTSALMAAVLLCGLSGCQADAEKAVQESQQAVITTTEQVCSSVETISLDEAHIETDFQITDWTMEDFLSDIEVNDKKLSLPCSYEELCKHFELELDSCSEFDGDYYYSYALRDNLYILASYHSENKTNNPSAEEMHDFYLSCTDDSCNFRFGDVKSNSSTREDVEKIFGKPNDGIPGTSWYRFDGSKAVIICYNENDNINYIHCYFGE